MSTIEKKRPHQACDRYQDWSKLFPDLLLRILESLNFIDFSRAKTVCLDWYLVWRTCAKPPRYPWQIIFKRDGSSVLYDPKEDKRYDTEKLLGHGFSDDSHFLNTCGNWLLMFDYSYNRLDPYILNVFTQKRINLPSMESSSVLGGNKSILKPPHPAVSVLSVNETTEDYFVAWLFNGDDYLFTHKKGDDSWRDMNIEGIMGSKILDMAYRNNDSKLYLITRVGHIKIIDFSGDCPKEIQENPYWNHPFRPENHIREKKLAITNSGEVLIISRSTDASRNKSFNVFKMNLESKKWEKVNSIGDNEMLIFGHGHTIKWPDSSYLAKGTLVLSPKNFDGFSETRWWFVPGFA